MGRITSTLLLALFAVAGTVGLTVIASQTVERSEDIVAQARLDFVLSRTAGSVERNLQLGLPLPELDQTKVILERAMRRAPAILAADVFSTDGRTIFSTDRGAVGEPVPPPWMNAIRLRHEDHWRSMDGADVTLGQPIRNDFGQIAGWAAVVVDRNLTQNAWSDALKLVTDAIPAIAVALVIAALIGLADPMGFARRRRGADPAAPLAVPGHGAYSGSETDHDVTLGSDPLATAISRAVATCSDAERDLEEASRRMKTLDAEV
ncbi:MAG: hypothetical protein AAGB11_08315 [Pseudomonadota bacterium]